MWICQVCGRQNEKGPLCMRCGADESLHYQKYRTLTAVEAGREAAGTDREGQKFGPDWDLEKLVRLEKLICQAGNGVPEAQRELGGIYKNEFSDPEIKKYGDLLIQEAGEAEEYGCEEEFSDRSPLVIADRNRREWRNAGRVAAAGGNLQGQCRVSGWNDIVMVSAGTYHTAGLKRDGTVIVTIKESDQKVRRTGIEIPSFLINNKRASDGQKDWLQTGAWRDIIEVSVGSSHAVGLRKDGTVVAVEAYDSTRREALDWTGIIAVSAGMYHTIGLKWDGTVIAAGGNARGQCQVSDWRDITAVAAGMFHTVGLRRDGTVVAVGGNEHGQCMVSAWRDVIAISAGGGHTVGLRENGTVIATGQNQYGQCETSGRRWEDIVAISAGDHHTVGLKRDGSVVAAGSNKYGQCDVFSWRNIMAVSAGGSHTAAIQKT